MLITKIKKTGHGGNIYDYLNAGYSDVTGKVLATGSFNHEEVLPVFMP